MKVAELVTTARDAITVSRVFAEPYKTDGVTVIAAATLAGGAGGGGATTSAARKARAAALGCARPAGAYVIKDGRVWCRPAIDVNRLFASIGAVAIAYLFTRVRIEKARAAIATRTPDRP